MERSPISPHISWSGPAPALERNAYLLAMLVRIHSYGLDEGTQIDRKEVLAPSVLTLANMPVIAAMYAFYRTLMAERNIREIEDMLKLIRDCGDEEAQKWSEDNAPLIRDAEAELLEYVDTPQTLGFRCFG